MDNVQHFRALGLSIPSAIRAALEAKGLTVIAFSFKYAIRRQLVSRALSGNEAPTEKLLTALILEIGGTRDEWRLLLHEAGRPAIAAGGM
ncbi:MAG TPA: hypothetical protein VIP11_23220 [Gemmatimonadaceae bacterium]